MIVRTALIATLIGIAGCAVARPPVAVSVDHGSGDVPLRDRFARARLELVDAINADRARHDAPAVAFDSLATVVAQRHAMAMAAGGFLSHFGSDGSAPYERMAWAGERGHVRENVFRYVERTDDPFHVDDPWPRFDIRDAERWLMESHGHRETILDATRTHVGIGIAVDPGGGAIYVVQEFLARYAEIEAPERDLRGGTAMVRGRMLREGLRPLMIFLARTPFQRRWFELGEMPPGGSYMDGGEPGRTVPGWDIRWNPTDRTFEIGIPFEQSDDPARWYAILYVAPEARVVEAFDRKVLNSRTGWQGAAFVIDVF